MREVLSELITVFRGKKEANGPVPDEGLQSGLPGSQGFCTVPEIGRLCYLIIPLQLAEDKFPYSPYNPVLAGLDMPCICCFT